MSDHAPSLSDANSRIRKAVEARSVSHANTFRPSVGVTLEKTVCDCAAAEISDRFGSHLGCAAYHAALEELRQLHCRKAADYGSARDPLKNIRSGAEFVGIEPWRAAMVRIADKVSRLATHNRTGSLENEGVEDTLLDLASYAILALVLYRELAATPIATADLGCREVSHKSDTGI
jgi:hypothetical protein